MAETEKSTAELLAEFDLATAAARRELAAELAAIDADDDDDEDEDDADDDEPTAFSASCRCEHAEAGLVCFCDSPMELFPVSPATFAASPPARRMSQEQRHERLSHTSTGRAILAREAAPPPIPERFRRRLANTATGRAILARRDREERARGTGPVTFAAPAPAPLSDRARERLKNTSLGRAALKAHDEAAGRNS
jgi:hypothetical protein